DVEFSGGTPSRTLREHAGMHEAIECLSSARPCDRLDRLDKTAPMIPVAVRQHHRVNGPEIDAKNLRVPQEARPVWTGIEQHRAPSTTRFDRDEKRQAVMSTTDVSTGKGGQAPSRQQPRPLRDDVRRCRGEIVGDVVYDDEHIEVVYTLELSHTAASASALMSSVSRIGIR